MPSIINYISTYCIISLNIKLAIAGKIAFIYTIYVSVFKNVYIMYRLKI